MTSIPPSLPLADCPQLPSVHTLPAAAVGRIEFAAWRLAGTGRTARNRDVVGMLIMVRAPENPSALLRLLVTPHPNLRTTVAALPTGRRDGMLRPHERQLWLELPSPVSHRLNALIDVLHERDFRTTRRQIVSALALHRVPAHLPTLVSSFDLYRNQTARDAAVAGRPLRVVLDATPPKPGRRAM